ncbi:hypothetical protein [Citrobacter portucalensis]|uniref:hypothetical protein n=1 Tax=Citrobacter portucalensis TaxID=1639133 RepID=UPI00226B4095|nr:hypothetical protein [Citrobacter portucalensis]MCX8985145.1 hypothetical protein [Citrobacter portucalensis]
MQSRCNRGARHALRQQKTPPFRGGVGGLALYQVGYSYQRKAGIDAARYLDLMCAFGRAGGYHVAACVDGCKALAVV